MALLDVDNLRTFFHTREGVVRAVDGVSFRVERGETIGIVGESGSGKSVTCASLLGLVPTPPGRIEGGSARFDGIDLLACPPRALRAIRGRRIGMIFQDPMSALNPYLTIGQQVGEPLRVHERMPKAAARARAIAMLAAVGIRDAAERLGAYPHQFSGGMRQRVMIAMALIAQPDLLIADEPTTALDVTVQAQILDLIRDMQRRIGTAAILVTHDLGVVAGMCERVYVMYAGRIVESAKVDDLFARPQHPYTRALLASMPAMRTKQETLFTIPGAPPDLIAPIAGCAFAPRCPEAIPTCTAGPVALTEGASGQASACVHTQAAQ